MGITGHLSLIGKLILTFLMIIGRIGVLTFGFTVTENHFDTIVEGNAKVVV
jgi:Trk-type K+ transport system membrane component